MRSEVKTKYCTVTFNEESYQDQGKNVDCHWATVEFSWGPKADRKAVAFGVLFDKRIETKAKEIFPRLLEVEAKDIYLEDTWLMVNVKDVNTMHQTARLIGFVHAAEEEFDKMCDPTGVKI